MSAVPNELSFTLAAGNYLQWIVMPDGSLDRQVVRLPLNIISASPNNPPAPPGTYPYWNDAEWQINYWLMLLHLYQWEMFPDAQLESIIVTENDGLITERFGYPDSGVA